MNKKATPKKEAGITEEQILTTLKDSPWFVVDAMITIYRRQTPEEVNRHETIDLNGVGFNGVDGRLLTSFSERVLEWENTPVEQRKYRFPLSRKQFALAKKKMPKYSRQLAEALPEDFDFDKYLNMPEAFKQKKPQEVPEVPQEVKEFCRLEVKDEHDAQGIVRSTYELLIAYLDGKTSYTVKFGKHFNKQVEEVPKSYIAWATRIAIDKFGS